MSIWEKEAEDVHVLPASLPLRVKGTKTTANQDINKIGAKATPILFNILFARKQVGYISALKKGHLKRTSKKGISSVSDDFIITLVSPLIQKMTGSDLKILISYLNSKGHKISISSATSEGELKEKLEKAVKQYITSQDRIEEPNIKMPTLSQKVKAAMNTSSSSLPRKVIFYIELAREFSNIEEKPQYILDSAKEEDISKESAITSQERVFKSKGNAKQMLSETKTAQVKKIFRILVNPHRGDEKKKVKEKIVKSASPMILRDYNTPSSIDRMNKNDKVVRISKGMISKTKQRVKSAQGKFPITDAETKSKIQLVRNKFFLSSDKFHLNKATTAIKMDKLSFKGRANIGNLMQNLKPNIEEGIIKETEQSASNVKSKLSPSGNVKNKPMNDTENSLQVQSTEAKISDNMPHKGNSKVTLENPSIVPMNKEKIIELVKTANKMKYIIEKLDPKGKIIFKEFHQIKGKLNDILNFVRQEIKQFKVLHNNKFVKPEISAKGNNLKNLVLSYKVPRRNIQVSKQVIKMEAENSFIRSQSESGVNNKVDKWVDMIKEKDVMPNKVSQKHTVKILPGTYIKQGEGKGQPSESNVKVQGNVFENNMKADEVIKQITSRITPHTKTMIVQLQPPHLGKIEINVVENGGRLIITMKAEHKDVKEILQKNVNLAIQAVQKHNIVVERINVERYYDENSQQQEQQNPGQGQEQHGGERERQERQQGNEKQVFENIFEDLKEGVI